MGIGIFFLSVSVMGKGGLRFYRSVMGGTAFNQGSLILGTYYKGGFASPMTRREAALILGVRESADESKINDAHRKLMMLNHPDLGGSKHIATKVNEAKEMIMKGSGG
jgi:DnaJ homolog subfamily C member 19|tara:strand:- start:301 stop:624 length:324 start_codon:yes stop_codon:yes gene_type:complete